MARLRVVQWTTGIVGASALRAILDDDRLELVGVFAYGAEKVGRDAGNLAGRHDTGVLATNDVDTILALRPDCVVYMPHWPEVDLLERILRAGINVVTTARLVSGEHYPADAGTRLRAAAAAGGVTLVGTGMNPMYVPTLALASTAMCREVQSIRVTESLDCVGYASAAMWKGYGFGGPPDTERLREILWAAEPDYREALDQLAGGIGLRIDDYDLAVECAVATGDRDLGFMRIDAGTVCGVDATWTGRSEGSPIAQMQTVWTLGGILGARQEPEWKLLHGYRIDVQGEPNVTLKLAFRPDDYANFDIGTTTAMPAINAVTAVVAARSGVLSIAELPIVTAQGKVQKPTA
ncbi:dihydrodipicolinate reductase [Mycobacterium sp. Aquia_213]|uniref:NAD(P)H-dependent amine dehydrogenase family protein n=1 Tax=Mycobacterium sp. Aquia_213 TaxID=2991728 RepID=UPI00226E8A47|nr:dihydrodipicolinate reductase [Mycobacterium sp. Aquia_213]WAC90141.1 dihydrodipicolinate reductase [Mycobacterium sp. Aquia_213]